MVTFRSTGPRAGQTFMAGSHRVVRGLLQLPQSDAEHAFKRLKSFGVYPVNAVPESVQTLEAEMVEAGDLDADVLGEVSSEFELTDEPADPPDLPNGDDEDEDVDPPSGDNGGVEGASAP